MYRTKQYSFVYSSACVEALRELMEEFFNIFELDVKLDDIFDYGVFCKEDTYANYKHWDEAPLELEVPYYLTNPTSSEKSRTEYVRGIIDQVITGEIEKPEWMIYVEMEETCNEYEQAPSNFLYLQVKDGMEKYEILGQKLIEFLYSPNLMTTLVNS